MLTGPDVSHHQGRVDWRAVAGAGHAFALCKATEGATFVDDRFGANWHGARQAGLVRGAYHFLRTEGSARTQAAHFLATMGDPAGSIAVLDVETSGVKTNPTLDEVRAFADEWAARTGGHPLLVYTARWFWHGILGDPQGSGLGPLWHARYSRAPGPLYGGWSGWALWQFTDKAKVPGISAPCDLNRFNGTRAQLLALTRPPRVSVPVPQRAEEEDDMFSDADRKRLERVEQRLAAMIEPGQKRSLRERVDDIERLDIERDEKVRQVLAEILKRLPKAAA